MGQSGWGAAVKGELPWILLPTPSSAAVLAHEDWIKAFISILAICEGLDCNTLISL